MTAYRITEQIDRCLVRLDESAGRRVARRNARRQMGALISSLKRMVGEKFPQIGSDGKERRPARKARRCPLCKRYFERWMMLVEHLMYKHGWKEKFGSGFVCPCGLHGSIEQGAKHLSHVKDIDLHATLNGLSRSCGVSP